MAAVRLSDVTKIWTAVPRTGYIKIGPWNGWQGDVGLYCKLLFSRFPVSPNCLFPRKTFRGNRW